MKKLILASGLLLLLTVTACQNKHKQGSGNLEHKTLTDSSIVKIIPEYAQGFKITYTDQACLLDIQDPQNKESQSFHYALVPRGVEAENIPADYTVIETPIRSVICMTSLQLSNFIKLEELDAVVGITSTRHLFNKKINDRLKDGSIHKIGIEGNFDNEVIMSVNPDLILISPFKRGGYDALKEVGIPLMPHLGYKEMTPLGQAEWIKFVGLLLGREDKANEQFATIKKRYNELKELIVCSFLCISVFYRIETISCSTQQDIAIVTFYHRIDTWLSAIRKLETGEIVRLIIIAHQSLGTTYPQVTFLIYQQVGDNVVSNGGCIFFVVQIVGKAVAVELAESVFGSHPDISVFILHNAVDKRT